MQEQLTEQDKQHLATMSPEEAFLREAAFDLLTILEERGVNIGVKLDTGSLYICKDGASLCISQKDDGVEEGVQEIVYEPAE